MAIAPMALVATGVILAVAATSVPDVSNVKMWLTRPLPTSERVSPTTDLTRGQSDGLGVVLFDELIFTITDPAVADE
jgi:hypothetical protein